MNEVFTWHEKFANSRFTARKIFGTFTLINWGKCGNWSIVAGHICDAYFLHFRRTFELFYFTVLSSVNSAKWRRKDQKRLVLLSELRQDVRSRDQSGSFSSIAVIFLCFSFILSIGIHCARLKPISNASIQPPAQSTKPSYAYKAKKKIEHVTDFVHPTEDQGIIFEHVGDTKIRDLAPVAEKRAGLVHRWSL